METEIDHNSKITDFNNANYLNTDGVKKLTLLLNAIVNKLD